MTDDAVEDRITLDLTVYHWRKRVGDVNLYGTWFEDARGWRQALVLTTDEIERDRTKGQPFIIPMDRAFIWTDLVGDPAEAAGGSFRAARSLGMNEWSGLTCQRLRSIIAEHVGLLLLIPPREQHSDKVVVADAFRSFEDGRVEHSEIIDHV